MDNRNQPNQPNKDQQTGDESRDQSANQGSQPSSEETGGQTQNPNK